MQLQGSLVQINRPQPFLVSSHHSHPYPQSFLRYSSRSSLRQHRRPSHQPPFLLGFNLAPASDTGVFGDAQTRLGTVELWGLTAPQAQVRLQGTTLATTALTTTARGDGRFLFANVALPLGQTALTVKARWGNQRQSFTLRLRRVATDGTDAVLDWNAIALRTIQLSQTGGLRASRTLAITQAAVFDAVHALTANPLGHSTVPSRSYRPVPVPIPTEASDAAAVAGAAHTVLTHLYPEQRQRLDAALAASLDQIPDSTSAEAEGLKFGQSVAEQLLAERATDGSDRVSGYRPQRSPGRWRPTPTQFLPAAGLSWRRVTPFVLNQGSQFRPAAPPRLNSATYAAEWEQVKNLGAIDSESRTFEQTKIARFWIGGLGTSTAPGMWNEIAARSAQQGNLTLWQNARLFAQLNLALADAGITAWDTKYRYRSWRPITAIRLAGSDPNPATKAVSDWLSFLETPAHPDYVSGHSTFAGAAAMILKQTFGPSQSLRVSSLDLPGEWRFYPTFDRAAAEAGRSRIYGGIHTQSANQGGLKLGRKVGTQVLRFFQVPV